MAITIPPRWAKCAVLSPGVVLKPENMAIAPKTMTMYLALKDIGKNNNLNSMFGKMIPKAVITP